MTDDSRTDRRAGSLGCDDGNHLVGAVWCDLIGEISNRRELCIFDEK